MDHPDQHHRLGLELERDERMFASARSALARSLSGAGGASIPLDVYLVGCAENGVGREEASERILRPLEQAGLIRVEGGRICAASATHREARPLYVNAYAVTRHFGGREEGGWWFDRGEPLASVPVDAEVLVDADGKIAGGDLREALVRPAQLTEIEGIIAMLRERFADVQCPRGRHSVLGGADLEVFLEENFAAPWPAARPRYE